MGQQQDSATQSQEITDEQKAALLETQRLHARAITELRNKTRDVFDSIGSVENKKEQAELHSNILATLVGREGLPKEAVFKRMLNDYPDSIDKTVELEGLEYEIADNYPTEHEVCTTISVENTHVDIDVTVDLHNEVYHGPSIDISKEVSLDGCDIIAAYMEKAGTEDPVFFLAKVTQLVFENAACEIRRVTRKSCDEQVNDRFEALGQEMRQLDTAKVELERTVANQYEACTKLQDDIIAMTDVLENIVSSWDDVTWNNIEECVLNKIAKVVRDHGVTGGE